MTIATNTKQSEHVQFDAGSLDPMTMMSYFYLGLILSNWSWLDLNQTNQSLKTLMV